MNEWLIYFYGNWRYNWLQTSLASQNGTDWAELPNCIQMRVMPWPSISHNCGLSLANSLQPRVTVCFRSALTEGSSWQDDHAAWLYFCHLVLVPLATNSKARLCLLGHWQGCSHHAAVGTLNQQHIKADIQTFTPSNCHLCSLAHNGVMAWGLQAQHLYSQGVSGQPSQKDQGIKPVKTPGLCVTHHPTADPPAQRWTTGLPKLYPPHCKSVNTYSLKQGLCICWQLPRKWKMIEC